MLQNRNLESHISLRDLFFHLLYHWRSVIIVMLIAAMLMAGSQYLQANKQADGDAWEQTMADYSNALEIYESSRKNLEASMESSVKQIEALKGYKDNSILMSIDPKAEWYAAHQYAILLDQYPLSETALIQEDTLRVFYTGRIDSCLDAEKIIQLTDAKDEQYARELISVIPGIPKEQSTVAANAAITIEVRGDHEETVRKVMDYIDSVVENIEKEDAQKIAQHQMILLNASVQLRVDPVLKETQEEVDTKIRSLQTGIQADQKALTGLSMPSEPQRNHVGIKELIKYALIGAFLGLFVMIGFYIASYILGGKLHLAEDVKNRYGLLVYGDFSHSRARKTGKGIDGLLEKWEFRHEKGTEQLLESVRTLIRENVSGKELLLVGTLSEEKLDSFREKLAEEMKDFSIIAGPDFIHSAKAISAAKRASAVLMVEEKNTARIREIDREAELLDINGTDVIGFIAL